MSDNGVSPKELRSGDLVIIEEGWRLVAGEPCEARLIKRQFCPASRAWDVWLAIVPRGGQTVLLEVDPWTRRAKLLQVRKPQSAEKGALHVS